MSTKEIIKTTKLNHIAIIMDGNRRWAKQKNLPSAMGHKKGVDSLREITSLCFFYRKLETNNWRGCFFNGFDSCYVIEWTGRNA